MRKFLFLVSPFFFLAACSSQQQKPVSKLDAIVFQCDRQDRNKSPIIDISFPEIQKQAIAFLNDRKSTDLNKEKEEKSAFQKTTSLDGDVLSVDYNPILNQGSNRIGLYGHISCMRAGGIDINHSIVYPKGVVSTPFVIGDIYSFQSKIVYQGIGNYFAIIEKDKIPESH